MTHDPGNGVWFFGSEKGPAPFHLVWTSRDSDGAGALLFHEPILTTPHALPARIEADRRAQLCLQWFYSNAARNPDPTTWPDPPHLFTLFLSGNPGSASSFGRTRPSKETLKLTVRILVKLGEVWPEWHEWLEANPDFAAATTKVAGRAEA
jgi:hypothetical protein